jgi:hypothetical protein
MTGIEITTNEDEGFIGPEVGNVIPLGRLVRVSQYDVRVLDFVF